jgi:WD40 repeat protein
MAYGSAQRIRDLLGRPVELMTVATFPQIFAPSWVTEGLAVYGESANAAGYGRLNNAWYEAEMRMEVQRGLRSLTEVSFEGYSGSRWPYGLNYLYGAYFFKFINERYGEHTAVNYIRIYSGNLIPWRMDKRSLQIFGKSADLVWDEFQEYLRQRFEPQLVKLKQENSAATKPVYDTPYLNRSLTAAGNGDLYFYHDDSSSHPQVRRIRADGSNDYLFETDNVTGLDWRDTAGLLLNKMAVCDNIKLYADLYRWKPGMTSPERLTHCGRYMRAAWRPDGQQIAAVQLAQGLSRLVLLDANGKNPQQLAELALGETIGHIAWSPDGELIVASVKRQHTGWNLELFKIRDQLWRPLTLNNDREVRPHFSKDGREVYFISDHDKMWNLRRINLADKTITTLSATISGIYEAVAMPDDSYRLIEYGAQGQSISSLPPAPVTGNNYPAMTPTPPEIDALVNTADYSPMPYENVRDYSALKSIKPRSWAPFLVSTADQNSYAGVSLYGADVLGFHQWTATPYYFLYQHTLGGRASYRFLNTLTLTADRQTLISGKNDDLFQYQSDEIRYQAMLHHSFNSTERSIYLAGGIANEHVKISLTQFNGINFSYQDMLAGIIARYDSTNYYQRSISPVHGRRIQFTGENYDMFKNSFYSGKTHQIDWREYIGLGTNHVLYLRMLLAGGDNGIRPYNLGGGTETYATLNGSTDLGRRKFMLRGYPAGLAALTGTQLGLVTAEWRIPLGLHYDGWFVPPLGLGRHSLSVFVDSGDAWNLGESMQRKTGAGIAWNAETLIGYDMLHLGTTLGVARGLDQQGESQLYFLMGTPF